MPKTLEELWHAQVEYNQRVRAKENSADILFWQKQYLLGAVAEVDEILQELSWKSHRKGHAVNRYNLAREIADLEKYVWCLWEINGFTEEDMLAFVEEKTTELDAQLTQDFAADPPAGSMVVITDIDGTLGDWRKAFYDWIMQTNSVVLLNQPIDYGTSMAIEVDLGIPYVIYSKLKEQFEAIGGYGLLEAYPDAVETIQKLAAENVYIFAYTARPARAHTRIWSDTLNWASDRGMLFQELRIGAEERISRACELKAEGCKVVMLEDDPGLAIRAATAGVDVCLRAQPYNKGVVHDYIARVMEFNASDILAMLKEQK